MGRTKINNHLRPGTPLWEIGGSVSLAGGGLGDREGEMRHRGGGGGGERVVCFQLKWVKPERRSGG